MSKFAKREELRSLLNNLEGNKRSIIDQHLQETDSDKRVTSDEVTKVKDLGFKGSIITSIIASANHYIFGVIKVIASNEENIKSL